MSNIFSASGPQIASEAQIVRFGRAAFLREAICGFSPDLAPVVDPVNARGPMCIVHLKTGATAFALCSVEDAIEAFSRRGEEGQYTPLKQFLESSGWSFIERESPLDADVAGEVAEGLAPLLADYPQLGGMRDPQRRQDLVDLVREYSWDSDEEVGGGGAQVISFPAQEVPPAS